MSGPLVLHGLDVSGATARRPANAEIGQIFFDETYGQPFIWNGFMWRALQDGPGNIRSFDHFLGDVIADQWSASQGSDAQGAIAAIVAASSKGEIILTAGDSNDINGISCLTKALTFAPANGSLIFEAKVKLSSIASVACFIGLSDVLATTTKEETASLATTTFTTAASDCLGFLFDTAATNDFWHILGVRADTDVSPTNTGVAPVADTYTVLRILLTATGIAKFYIDGVLVGTLGTVAEPVCTVATKLTESAYVNSRTTATKTMTFDYIDVDQTL
jgi:hypothetical protein